MAYVFMAVQAEGLLLQQSQKGKQSAHRVAAPQAPAEAVGADNAGHMVMLKPTLGTHTRKRQAEDNGLDAEAALDTQAQDQLQAAQIDSRVQEGQEEQDGELTLEQRVNALNLHQQPAGELALTRWFVLLTCCSVLANVSRASCMTQHCTLFEARLGEQSDCYTSKLRSWRHSSLTVHLQVSELEVQD